MEQKTYVRHSQYIGGRKETSLREMLKKKPEYVVTHAVKGMLPKNNLGRKMLSKFHVYAGPTHKHEAQKPEALTFELKK
jgi:large subunit ribosomal protein L13